MLAARIPALVNVWSVCANRAAPPYADPLRPGVLASSARQGPAKRQPSAGRGGPDAGEVIAKLQRPRSVNVRRLRAAMKADGQPQAGEVVMEASVIMIYTLTSSPSALNVHSVR